MQALAKGLAPVRGFTRPSADLLSFVPRLNPRYTPPKHLAPLVAEFERAWREEVRCTAHAPPRHGKTETVLAFLVLTLLLHPTWTVAYVTYEANLARSKSRRAREWARSAGLEIADDANRMEEWRTRQGGGLLATGVGGPLTGQGVQILVVDDPYKNRIQAESHAYRQMVTDWWGDVGNTRIEPGGSAFIFHTRWTADDLIGHVHDSEDAARWGAHVHMPAISPAGVALWPERWPVDELRKKELANAYTWASLYQGMPRPRGGSVFGDVHTYRELPNRLRRAVGIDLAYSEKTTSDYSVAILAGECDGKVYVIDVVRGQWLADRCIEKFKPLLEAAPHASAWRWYCAGPEKGIATLFGAAGIDIDAKQATADKFVRAQPVAAAWNRGDVLIPEDAPWADDFVAEMRAFTGVRDRHDDQADALAAVFDELTDGGGESLGPLRASSRWHR